MYEPHAERGPPAQRGQPRVAVLGLGETGRLAAIAFADAGFTVLGYEPDAARRDAVGHTPGVRVAPRWDAPSGVEAALLCVGTPLLGTTPDPSALLNAVREVGARGAPPLVVIESTVAPGFLEEEILPLLPPGTLLAIAPERVDPGRTTPAYVDIPRVVGGVGAEATAAAVALYRRAGFVVYPATAGVAVYTKHLENAFRLVNIALLGEFAELCARDGVNIDAVVEGAATKPFGYTPFRAGPGAGGECIPVDPAYLAGYAANLGVPVPTVAAALTSNRARPVRLAHTILSRLPRHARRVLLVGVAYKPGTADLRETPARPLAEALEAGGCEVAWWDAQVHDFRGTKALPPDRWEGIVDALVLLHPPPPEAQRWLTHASIPVFDVCGANATHTADPRMRL